MLNSEFKKLFLFFVLSFIIIQKSFSQKVNHNNDVWFHYFGKNMFTKKLSFTLEATMRYANGFSEKQQWFIRPSVDYQFNKSLVGSVGYSHYDTYVYGETPLNKINTPEDHIWIQGTYTANLGNFKFINRLRDEFRFVGIPVKNTTGDYVIDHYEHRNRLRYMFLVNYPLTKDANGKSKLFLNVGDEAFLNIDVTDAKTLFQQNRAIAGLGYNINAHHQVQLNYIHQNIWNLGNTIQEKNPTLRISYLTNFDWFKK
ncbi:hypothetical protein B0A78_03330 [Flavobacterium columnare NBRC 100251 = ATCC 23463]|uniref:DUF2490 domain-containing protein n=1 Tax=Flavobacterium columnare TaxID=996 RepID=UPI000BEA47B2|nr:DUF2490 domain-containing protein [Flavobacterium columnare]PDS26053.1 hypothetical protein B0A78_03330 [Flavobacterium columnare NBRC 100251 = ATCC 23463]QOG89378.1 DUF2490 domain-containing protein [Flavobacterium columnare]QOG92038.1 DUF2490 domain-containing protein [Flavobacterium columnare]QOG94702.1 DUF2490 domain-containing protein [Flavobacterium columnare]QOG97361.1 DUF2490 domain-containing protein [Flavobacterium columnare]